MNGNAYKKDLDNFTNDSKIDKRLSNEASMIVIIIGEGQGRYNIHPLF